MDAFSSDQKCYKFEAATSEKNVFDITLTNPMAIRGYSVKCGEDKFPNNWNLMFREKWDSTEIKELHKVKGAHFKDKYETKVFMFQPEKVQSLTIDFSGNEGDLTVCQIMLYI